MTTTTATTDARTTRLAAAAKRVEYAREAVVDAASALHMFGPDGTVNGRGERVVRCDSEEWADLDRAMQEWRAASEAFLRACGEAE